MPLYEYRCPACGATFELLRRMREADDEVKCPKCSAPEAERLLSAFSSGACSSRFR